VTTTSEEAIAMTKTLALEEGIFCGISSGCNIAAAVKIAKKRRRYKSLVTMLNDSGQRYFSTELWGEKKTVEIPTREHPLEKQSAIELNRYQEKWDIIQ
jgi:cysteine synthase A